MIVLDADVLGRDRTGDETYVANLLQALAALKGELRIGAITRDASLVPDGIEPLVLATGSQELRMAVTLPRLLPTLGPAGMRSDWLMTLALRWMGNLVTDEDRDRAARVWRWAGRRSLARDARPPFA